LAYCVWSFFITVHFQRLNRNFGKENFWLKLFYTSVSKRLDELKLSGYPNENKRNFLEFSSSLQSFMVKWIFINSFTMVFPVVVQYVYLMRVYSFLHTPVIFWGILIVIFFSLKF
jgi:hypothetical protein